MLEQGARKRQQFIGAELVELVGIDLRNVEHEAQCRRRRRGKPSAHARIACVSENADHTGNAYALPGQTEHECIQLLVRDGLRRTGFAARPDEAALMQSPRG